MCLKLALLCLVSSTYSLIQPAFMIPTPCQCWSIPGYSMLLADQALPCQDKHVTGQQDDVAVKPLQGHNHRITCTIQASHTYQNTRLDTKTPEYVCPMPVKWRLLEACTDNTCNAIYRHPHGHERSTGIIGSIWGTAGQFILKCVRVLSRDD